MPELQKIIEKLTNDLQEIARAYMACFGCKKLSSRKDSILCWLLFAIHLIEPKERVVHYSKGFWNRAPKNYWLSINRLADKFKYGCDVNPFLSKSLKNAMLDKRADLLWTDWDIHHFHLNEEVSVDSDYSKRSDYVLFAIVGDDFVCFWDVKKHPPLGSPDYADSELYGIICDSWPNLIDDLKNFAPDKGWSKEEILQFRKQGLNACYSHNGKVLALGGNFVAGGKPIRSIILRDKIHFEIRKLSERIIECTVKQYKNFSENDFSLKMDSDGLKLCFTLENSCTPLSSPTINDFFNKKWLVAKLRKNEYKHCEN